MGRKANPETKDARTHIVHRTVSFGKTYRMNGGLYKTRLVKVVRTLPNPEFVVVILLDAFGEETSSQDVVPVRYME